MINWSYLLLDRYIYGNLDRWSKNWCVPARWATDVFYLGVLYFLLSLETDVKMLRNIKINVFALYTLSRKYGLTWVMEGWTSLRRRSIKSCFCSMWKFLNGQVHLIGYISLCILVHYRMVWRFILMREVFERGGLVGDGIVMLWFQFMDVRPWCEDAILDREMG